MIDTAQIRVGGRAFTDMKGPQGVWISKGVVGNSAKASSAKIRMARFEYLTKSSDDVSTSDQCKVKKDSSSE